MKKYYASLTVALIVVAIISGCSGFKGFCDRGSLFPTRQPQLVPTQSVYSITSDMCCSGEVTSVACDPCGSASGSGTAYPFPGPSY